MFKTKKNKLKLEDESILRSHPNAMAILDETWIFEKFIAYIREL
jgi:hypothetical protein